MIDQRTAITPLTLCLSPGVHFRFVYAGAARVLASLWEVDDYATAGLMRLFYEGVEISHMRPAAALRAAQLRMLKDTHWRSPYFWASL